jgi:outer membrane protein
MRRALAATLLAAVWALAFAAPAAAEPLADALARVYNDNPRLQAGREGLRAVDEAVARARAAGRPFLSGSSTIAVGPGGNGPVQAQRQALSLTQSLYSGGETKAAVARAQDSVLAERARLMQLEQDVLLEGVSAYAAVAREASVLKLARDNEERLRVQLDATRDRERFGDVTKTDVAQAQTRHAGAIAGRIAAEGAARTAAAEYRRVIGVPPDALSLPDPPEEVATSFDDALAQAPQSWRVQAAGHDVAAARDEVAVALAGLKPRLSLGAEIGYAASPGWQQDQRTGASVGATLTVPLYQGGGEHARVRQSKDLLQQRRHARDDVRRAVEAEIAAAWEALASADAAIRSLESQVDSAGFALEGVRQEAMVGARVVLDVLDAEQELYAAEVGLVRARGERVLAGYRLRAALGRLTAHDLGLPVTPQDPAAHLDEVGGRWFGLGEAVPED